MSSKLLLSERIAARRLIITGRVQGLGVRPALCHAARELGLAGSVSNTTRGVEIQIEGRAEDMKAFVVGLPSSLPEGAECESLIEEEIAPAGREEFSIVTGNGAGPSAARVPEDLAVCAECLTEVSNPADRRFRYPFTSCTACGPRWSIIRHMPYERPDTTMAAFTFCPECSREYRGAGERRFHAQTNACPACGPRLWAVMRDGRQLGQGEDALRAAAACLARGEIVAVRGLGGYQLLVDANCESAVRRLRARKQRPAKPLAVMVDSLQTAEQLAYIDQVERAALADTSNPIVLVRARDITTLAASIHPGLDTVGLLLPTTPLHALLLEDRGRPLVCTSGNRQREPIEFEVQDAERRLSGVCDLWLHHDRPIARPVDDSVVRVMAGQVVTLRLARGLAPLPLELTTKRPTLSVGGHLKSAVAFSNGAQAVLGPHIGDPDSVASRERYEQHGSDMQALYRFQPETLVHDLHPDYFSTAWASRQHRASLGVQHHHAHIVAGMLEHGWLDREVLGLSFDGAGYGADGTIWGGEVLICTAHSFRRVGHLRPFPLPGGEAAIRQPWRTALAIGRDAVGMEKIVELLPWLDPAEVAAILKLIERRRFSPTTTSAGRLFDAAAAMILGVRESAYEGQAAMLLEAAADRGAPGRYELAIRSVEGTFQLDWRALFAALLRDLVAGVEPGTMAMRFHRTLAAAVVQLCQCRPELPVVLGGGVFQNRLLVELVVEMWPDGRRPLGLPGRIPPNDGGLAAGQLAIAAAMKEKHPCA